MSNDLVFSVIMPCYNSAAYINEAIESIIGQTYGKWELVAVNDGSTDTTLAVIKAYAKNDNRIKIISKENGGYVSAVNVGLDNVSGDYFMFMGSDDRLALDFFKKACDEIKDKSPDIIGFRTVRFVDKKNGGLDKYTSFSTSAYLMDSNIQKFEELYPQHSEIFFTRDTSKLFKFELLEDLRYLGKYGVDADGIFTMLFTHKAKSFMSIPIDGYYWTIREDSLSRRAFTNEINIDRISNWLFFYNQLNSFYSETITLNEKKYIFYYLTIVQNLYKTVNRKDENINSLLKKSIKQIRLIIKKYEYQKYFGKLSLRQKMFINYPNTYTFISKLRGK